MNDMTLQDCKYRVQKSIFGNKSLRETSAAVFKSLQITSGLAMKKADGAFA